MNRTDKYFLSNLRAFVILRRLQIEKSPFELFGYSDYNFLDDFEYSSKYGKQAGTLSAKEVIDGYEINIFPIQDIDVNNNKHTQQLPEKRFVGSLFLGDRNPGDIGYLIDEMIKKNTIGGKCISTTCHFSQEIYNKYYPIIFDYYDIRDQNIGVMRNFLIQTKRDRQINEII